MDRNARLGLANFAVYLLLYLAFVLTNALAPGVMERTIGGVNLAVLCGFGLIATAFVMAVVYGLACGRPLSPSAAPTPTASRPSAAVDSGDDSGASR